MAANLPILLFTIVSVVMSLSILVIASVVGPERRGAVKDMPYESGMDPIRDARQRFSIGFYLLAIEFLVFDVEVLFLIPWTVASGGTASLGHGVFLVAMGFLAVLTLGFVYTWRKGVFKW